MKIDIVIVNWNAGTQLQDCINSVRAHHAGIVGKCIVIDNGSTDGSADFLCDTSDVDLMLTGQNLGFAKACNLGAARGSADFVLFLNPDAMLLPGSLAGALSVLQLPENERVGIVGVQLVGEDDAFQRTCARFPSPLLLIAKSTGLSSLVKSLDFHMHRWPHNQTMRVDHVIGAFYLIRRPLFDRLEGFDETFFVYLEDLDLSYRAAKIGYHSLYLADVQAFHKGGGVSEQVKAHRLFYSLRSRIQYAFKHFSMLSAILVMFTTLIVEPVSRLIFLLLRGSAIEIPDLGRGYRMLWGWIFAKVSRGRFSD
jgi:GT2 family glycosyltransferase